MEHEYEYSARVTRVIDGDTLVVHVTKSKTLDFGFHFKQEIRASFDMRVRLYGIDTPETRGKKAKTEGEAGRAATKFVIDWLDRYCEKSVEGDWLVHIRTHDGKKIDAHPGKYHDRWIAEVWTRGVDAIPERRSLIEDLKAAGHDKLTGG